MAADGLLEEAVTQPTGPDGPLTLAPGKPPMARWKAVAITLAVVAAGLAVLGYAGRDNAIGTDRFAEAAEQFQEAAPGATETCCETLAITMGAGGNVGVGEGTALGELLGELGFTAATIDRMSNTRALDGTQTAESDHATLWWTFHPDDGLQITIEPD